MSGPLSFSGRESLSRQRGECSQVPALRSTHRAKRLDPGVTMSLEDLKDGGAGDGRRDGPPTAEKEEQCAGQTEARVPDTQRGGPDPASPDSAAERPTWRPQARPPLTHQPPPGSGHHTGVRDAAGHTWAPGPTETTLPLHRWVSPPISRSGASETLGVSLFFCLLLTGD